MKPRFNTAGPCVAGEHYMLPPERRLGRVRELIDDGLYFVLYAGRQTGKTTCARWLQKHIETGGERSALWVDCQTAGGQPDPAQALRTMLGVLDEAAQNQLPTLARPGRGEMEAMLADPHRALVQYIHRLTAASPRPLVLLLDEADGLAGPSMVTVLRQLREGYIARSSVPFPHSLGLVGARQVRDYPLGEGDQQTLAWLGTQSPFNVTAEALTLAPFTEAEVAELLGQHTEATGQRFEPEAAARVFELSQGHPWLSNALADLCVDRLVRDRAVPLTPAHVDQARETMILERRTHIDSLLARLREPRVRRLFDAMLAGEGPPADLLDDDVAYVAGLGLVRTSGGRLEISNPIYREIIPRALTYVQQIGLFQETAWYLTAEGGLDVPRLLAAWQAFWRKDGHLAAEAFDYREAGPHLMLMAFLQRILNGGGRIEREYALGKGALDLLLAWKSERYAIEVKLRRDTETEDEALDQVERYLDSLGLLEGWLVFFDLRKSTPWPERIFTRTLERGGKQIHLIGC